MSLIPFDFFPRTRFDIDRWFREPLPRLGRLSSLDLFDPFDEFDRSFSRDLFWLRRPEFPIIKPPIGFGAPLFPRKYRVTLDAGGFRPESIKTSLSGNRLTVSARDEENFGHDNYSVKELKKTYELPIDSEMDKFTSFMTPAGQLVMEVPLRGPQFPSLLPSNNEFFPKISDDKKNVSLEFNLPERVDPSKINVTCKDREIIIKAEDKVEKPDSQSSFSFYQRSTLPENTDLNAIKCTLNNNKLSVTAPLLADHRTTFKQIPIDNGRRD